MGREMLRFIEQKGGLSLLGFRDDVGVVPYGHGQEKSVAITEIRISCYVHFCSPYLLRIRRGRRPRRPVTVRKVILPPCQHTLPLHDRRGAHAVPGGVSLSGEYPEPASRDVLYGDPHAVAAPCVLGGGGVNFALRLSWLFPRAKEAEK